MKIRQYSRKDAILLELLNKNGDVSFHGLCIQFKVSERTIRSEISDIKEILKKYQLHLKKTKGIHYHIERHHAVDIENIEKLKTEIEKAYFDDLYDTQNDRILYLLRRLVLSSEYLKLGDIADDMYVSKSTISADMNQVRAILRRYELVIQNKPHYGMKVEGSENAIRKCILDYGLINEDVFSPNESLDIWSKIMDDPDYELVDQVLKEVMSQEAFQMYGTFLNNLIMHVLLAVKRIRSHCYVERNVNTICDGFQREYEAAKRIAAGIAAVMDIEFPESEIRYLQLHMIGKQSESGDIEGYDDLQYLSERMIQSASDLYNCHFHEDEQLRKDLLVHLKAVKSRLEIGTHLRNPLMGEIKSQYPFAFEIAISCIKNEWNWMRLMSDDEIGYIAVHFAASLERTRKRTQIEFKNVLLVCASGIGTARLMEARLKQYFKERIHLVVHESIMHLKEIAFDAYDLILTTVPIKGDHQHVMCIHAIPSHVELEQIEQYLFQDKKMGFSIEQIFQEEFFTIREHANREELMEEICEELYQKGIVEKGFHEGVMQREECSTTAVGNLVALPHSIKPLAHRSIIYTCIIKNGIGWTEEDDVQIIFLLAIRFREAKWFMDIYDLIVQIVEEKEFVYRCIDCNSYDDFIRLLNDVRKKG